MRYLVPGGGTAVFLLLLMTLLFIDASPVAAQEPESPPSWFDSYVAVSSGGLVPLLMLVGIVAATAAGILGAKRPDPWPHWPGLVRSLGDAAFLLALITTFAGMRTALQVVARLGAAVTPSDIAAGLAQSLSDLVLGATVALAGLVGAGLLRWRQTRAASR